MIQKPQSSDNADWEQLATASQKGDKRAYQTLLKEIAPYIRNIAYKSVSNAEAAEDIMQEVLISVHKSLSTYSADRPFKPWLLAILNFRRTDYLRKYYAKRQDKTTTTEENYEFEAENVTNPDNIGELKDIENALSALPDKQREIFQLIKIEGYTAEEVANKMDMKVSAVKVSAHRTAKKLKGVLGE